MNPTTLSLRSLTHAVLLMLTLGTWTSCKSEMKKEKNLESWLETHFPGQLVVVENIIDLDPRNLFYKKKSSIVADKNDPEVQIKVTWFKNEEGLGLNKEEVQTSLENSKRDVQAARNICKALKENRLEQFSVGVIDMAVYILLYTEPAPETRKAALQKILATLNTLPSHEQTSIWIEYMEPSIYQEEFKDIVPFGYWQRPDSYHQRNKILSLDFEWSEGLEADILNTGWAFNTDSERTMKFKEEAFTLASTWAAKNLSAPYYLEPDQLIQVGPDEDDPLAVLFLFPYYTSKPDTTAIGDEPGPLGHVSVSYQTDRKTYSKIKKEKAL